MDVHAAARLGRVDRLRKLVEADPESVHARGGDGQTPLHFARTVEIAAYLLDHGADIDALDIDHESTPRVMLGDRVEVARYLVDRGCTTDILLAAAVGNVERVRKHLDADPDCIRVRASEEFFPMVNPKAGGKIYRWTLGYRAIGLPGGRKERQRRCTELAHGTESPRGEIHRRLLAARRRFGLRSRPSIPRLRRSSPRPTALRWPGRA